MKNFYSILVATLLATGAFAQCSVNPLSTLTVVSPLPTDNLPSGSVGLPYQGSGVSISFNASGQEIEPALLAGLAGITLPTGLPSVTFSVTKVNVTSVSGVPAGMTLVSPSNPTVWNVGQSGCFLLSGTPTAAGSYDITFNTIFDIHYTSPLQNGDQTTPAAPVKYTMVVNDDASIAEFTASGFNLFPNPASDMFTVSYPSTGAAMATIEITDMSGKVVASTKQSINAQGGNVQVDINGLANGMYRVTFASGSVRTASKLAVRK